MGYPLLLGFSQCRNYITDACASTRHASVLCSADGHAHTCAHEGAMYTHGTEMQWNSVLPPSLPLF